MSHHDMYYPNSIGSGGSLGGDSCNSTPFSVKDILNLVEQNGEGYLGCHVEGHHFIHHSTTVPPQYLDYDHNIHETSTATTTISIPHGYHPSATHLHSHHPHLHQNNNSSFYDYNSGHAYHPHSHHQYPLTTYPYHAPITPAISQNSEQDEDDDHLIIGPEKAELPQDTQYVMDEMANGNYNRPVEFSPKYRKDEKSSLKIYESLDGTNYGSQQHDSITSDHVQELGSMCQLSSEDEKNPSKFRLNTHPLCCP